MPNDTPDTRPRTLLDLYSEPRDSDGPAKAVARATLKGRPARALYEISLDEDARVTTPECTFAALFNGARQGNGVPGFGMSFGKAEAEWGWPKAWEALRDAGLIDFEVTTYDAPGAVGGIAERVTWSITDKGREVRADDLAWHREMSDACWKDGPAPTPPQEDTQGSDGI